MKVFYYLWPLLLLLAACRSEENTIPTQDIFTLSNCEEQPSVCELTDANNTFGFHLFQRLHEEAPADNLFISPFSIATALTMTLNGADGATYEAMNQTLAYGEQELDQINGAYQLLLSDLPLLDPSVTMQPANSVWYRQSFHILDSFKEVNATYFYSPPQEVDFRDPATVDQINGWISDHTGGKIDELLEVIPAEAVMYLINAVYFKGAWRWPFDPADTGTVDFTKNNGEKTPTPMMRFPKAIEAPVFFNATVSGVDLPFGDSTFAMTLLLPAPESSVDAVVGELAAGAWPEWTASLAVDEVTVALPRLALRYQKKLNEVLKAMGMAVAFSGDGADFSKMSPADLFISLVKHEAFIEVNEAGAEGGAATLVEISREAATLNELVFNRPFVFVIREVNTNSVLFAGKMMDPQY